jgi:RNA polymerase sigma-70 factor (ECF subfamily)
MPSNSDELSPALEEVVSRFGELMRATARRHGLAPHEVEDAVQDVRIRLWRALGSSEKIRAAPASYIRRTVVSATVDFIRRRRARREDTMTSDPDAHDREDPPSRADAPLEEHEMAATIARAVDALVESRRAVVRMYLAGYEREEIGDLLGWTEAKTRNLLYRGLDDLRTTLARWGVAPTEGSPT